MLTRLSPLSHFQPLPRLTIAFSLLLLTFAGCETVPTGTESPTAQGYAAPSALNDGNEAGGDAASVSRDIIEADVIQIVGDKLYALNRYKGLLIIDIADPDNPTALGNLDLRGRGVEMYVEDDKAYILLSADFYYMYEDDVFLNGASAQVIRPDVPMPPRPEYTGSQLAIVDVGDPTQPTSEGKIDLVGYANESRRVGDVIYVIGSNDWFYYAGDLAGDSANVGEGFVASVNIANPDDVQAVDRLNIEGHALNMHASETAIFAASREYDYDEDETVTNIQIVDISDPDGAITLRDNFEAPGYIDNRFYMDAFDGVFRIATESFGFGFRLVRLFTYDLSDIDSVTALGQTEIIRDEGLEAVRFDGPRAYAVTFLQVDPLFVLDLSDPATPAVTGELEVPGFSTHIEPRGDRLIAVGIDDTDGRRPAVAYYDVSDPTSPTQLGRVILGPPGSFTSSEATYDEKAFKIVDELGLIAMPFRHVDWGETLLVEVGTDGLGQTSGGDIVAPECMNGVQLVDFNDTALTQRGWFEHTGEVHRVGVIGNRVFALSQLSFQTVDITNRDAPIQAGQTDLLDPDEMEMWDDCSGFYFHGWTNDNFEPGALFGLLQSCGALGIAPMLLVPGCLLLGRRTLTRIRSRR